MIILDHSNPEPINSWSFSCRLPMKMVTQYTRSLKTLAKSVLLIANGTCMAGSNWRLTLPMRCTNGNMEILITVGASWHQSGESLFLLAHSVINRGNLNTVGALYRQKSTHGVDGPVWVLLAINETDFSGVFRGRVHWVTIPIGNQQENDHKLTGSGMKWASIVVITYNWPHPCVHTCARLSKGGGFLGLDVKNSKEALR